MTELIRSALLSRASSLLIQAIVLMVCAYIIFVGVALVATLRATDPARRATFHQVLRDLLSCLKRESK